jgi:hypothetical protein
MPILPFINAALNWLIYVGVGCVVVIGDRILGPNFTVKSVPVMALAGVPDIFILN